MIIIYIKNQSFSFVKVGLLVKYTSQKKKIGKIPLIFDAEHDCKIKILQSSRRLFIILVGLSNLLKKS